MFGLILAGLIRAFVPEEAFATWFGATMGGLWLTLLATTVIEVCSEGSTPDCGGPDEPGGARRVTALPF